VITRGLIATLPVLLAGCPEDDIVPRAVAARVLAEAECRAHARCGCDQPGDDLDLCVIDRTSGLEPRSPGDTYDGACVQRQLEWIDAVGCLTNRDVTGDTDLELAKMLTDCSFFYGDLGPGEPCGEEEGACEQGLVCSYTCRPPQRGASVGEPCGGDGHPYPCEPGAFCVNWGYGAGHRCEHGTEVGGPCRGPADAGQCDRDDQQKCDLETFTCTFDPNANDSCDDDSPASCGAPAICTWTAGP